MWQGAALMTVWIAGMPSAWAVVGQAEQLDPFVEQDLREYHENLVNEESSQRLLKSDELKTTLKNKEKQLRSLQGADSEEVNQEIEDLKRQLLSLPKRDRFQIELVEDFKYDSNIQRRIIRDEKGDSVFESTGTALFDLSGRKTDLRFELAGKKQWNIHFSENDTWLIEERLRSRRKWFKKLQASANSIFTRTNSKTVEIDAAKIRYDTGNQISVNYPFSQKLSFNSTFGLSKRIFPQEAFDQDSGWEVTAAPAAFWNFTPKSRISLGYTFGASRSQIKTGDTNSHQVDLGYFGQVTRKSSASLTTSFQHQQPRSRDTAESNTVTAGIGYIWQLTPKTQMTIQFIRSLQNSTSNLTSGEVDGNSTTTRTDSHFTNDSLSFSLNSRLTRKLTAILTFNGSHVGTTATTSSDAIQNELNEETETAQYGIPVSLQFAYVFARWLRVTSAYTFSYRTGNERTDKNRSHLWQTTATISF